MLPGGKLVSILQWSAPCRSDQSCTAIDLILETKSSIGKRRGGLAARLISVRDPHKDLPQCIAFDANVKRQFTA